jgi:hypothetical protein
MAMWTIPRAEQRRGEERRGEERRGEEESLRIAERKYVQRDRP